MRVSRLDRACKWHRDRSHLRCESVVIGVIVDVVKKVLDQMAQHDVKVK